MTREEMIVLAVEHFERKKEIMDQIESIAFKSIYALESFKNAVATNKISVGEAYSLIPDIDKETKNVVSNIKTLNDLLEQECQRGLTMRRNIPGFNAIYKIVEGQYQEETA